MIGEDEHSIFVRIGITPEEEMKKVDEYFDHILYSKPGAFVRKIKRKFKK